ncbi:MAG: DUF2141 domain-containing protein [Bacteroidia bacterium]|jgi:choloylglycine hydrolase|nr:DUF2141 domain-containing protein [Bacteroidia bacterium]
MKYPSPFIILLGAFLTLTQVLSACSAFYVSGNRKIQGRNFDWYNGNGYLIKNNRGQEKYAYSISNTSPAHWTAKFGSLTFNQIGKEFPYGGINEKGLIVEQLWLHGATYRENNTPTISELEWIQFQLDCFERVDEVLAHINDLTIVPVKATVHYFVADKTGNSAVIDFLGGQVFISVKTGYSQVVTNTSYLKSCKYYEMNGDSVNLVSRLSEDRFCQVTRNLTIHTPENYREAFDILAQSAENEPDYKTFWSIVYDLDEMCVRFHTFDRKNIRLLKLSEYDFSFNSGIQALALNSDQDSPVPYSYKLNQTLLVSSLTSMDIQLDTAKAARHQYFPDMPARDEVYMNTYVTVKIRFVMKKATGNLYYTLAQGEQNFNSRRGAVSTMLAVDSSMVYSAVYSVKKGEYGLAAFHDVNGNKRLDGGVFGIPREPYSFYRNKRRLFVLPPKYDKIKFELKESVELTVVF